MTPNSKLRIKPKEEQKTKSSSKGFSLKHRAKPTCGKQASKKKHYGFRNVLVHTEYKDEGSLLRQVHGFGVFLALLCYHSVKKKPAQTQNHPQTNPPPPQTSHNIKLPQLTNQTPFPQAQLSLVIPTENQILISEQRKTWQKLFFFFSPPTQGISGLELTLWITELKSPTQKELFICTVYWTTGIKQV